MKKYPLNSIGLAMLMCLSLSACDRGETPELRTLERAPSSIGQFSDEARLISDFKKRIERININKKLASIKDEKERVKLRQQFDNLRKTYNRSVIQLEEVKKAEGQDRIEKSQELQVTLNQLQTNWNYIIKNYKI